MSLDYIRHYKKQIRAAYVQASLQGTYAPLDLLSIELGEKEKELQVFQISSMTALETALNNPDIDERSAEEILIDAKNTDRQSTIQQEIFERNPHREKHVQALKIARKTIADIYVSKSAYTPMANLKRFGKLAVLFTAAALALTYTIDILPNWYEKPFSKLHYGRGAFFGFFTGTAMYFVHNEIEAPLSQASEIRRINKKMKMKTIV